MGFEDIYNIEQESNTSTVLKKSDVSIISLKQKIVGKWNLFIALTSLLAVTVSLYEVNKYNRIGITIL